MNIPIQQAYHSNNLSPILQGHHSNNMSPIQEYNTDLSPLLMQQMQGPGPSNGLRQFNVNATRSNSSSSSQSNSSSSSSGGLGQMQQSARAKVSQDSEFDLADLKNRGKLFEDDVIFCPRALLSQSELKTREEMDRFIVDMMLQQQQQLQMQQMQQMQGPKFNPYASKSFTPGN